MSSFPTYRPRRLRRTAGLRALIRETVLDPRSLVQPVFVLEGEGRREQIEGLPGIERMSTDELVGEVDDLVESGIGGVLIFGVPDTKDESASAAYDPDGVVPQAVRAIKSRVPDFPVITDVCLCSYTDHGHCGLIQDGEVVNDLSVEVIARTALAHAEAGADLVAPSDMMDGRVAAIRSALDQDGHSNVAILSYAAKYSSALYGPFREAASSTPTFGDRRGYQMDPANSREALRELRQDVEQATDILMIKPAIAYLDIIAAAKERFDLPIAAYNTSGEYAMVKAAGEKGWIDESLVALELLTGIRRAGADFIVTYWASQVTELLG